MFPEDRMMEVLMIGALALIVIGPKDLPIAMRKLGQFVAKMRGMAAEFRASFDELARQSELEDLRKEVEALRVSRESLTNAFNPLADPKTIDTVNEINQQMGQVQLGPQMTGKLDAERAAAQAAHAPVPDAPAFESPPVMTALAPPAEVDAAPAAETPATPQAAPRVKAAATGEGASVKAPPKARANTPKAASPAS